MGKNKKKVTKEQMQCNETLAQDIFQKYPNAKVVFISNDDQAFLSEHHAKNHCNLNDLDYIKVRREDASEVQEETNTDEQ